MSGERRPAKGSSVHFYKCRKVGCKCNRNAHEMHDLFLSLLDGLTLKEELIPSVQYELENFYHEITRDSLQQEDILKGQLSEINKKIEAAEESLLLKQAKRKGFKLLDLRLF